MSGASVFRSPGRTARSSRAGRDVDPTLPVIPTSLVEVDVVARWRDGVPAAVPIVDGDSGPDLAAAAEPLGVDAALLARAFDEVIAEHPTLRARIAPDGAGHAFELLAERPHLHLRSDVDTAHGDELNDPLPVGGPLVRATLASDPPDSPAQRHLLVISIDHACIDGHSAIALQNSVWDR